MADVVVRRHPDVNAFLTRAQVFLVRREAENVLMIGVASSASKAEHALTVERGPNCVMAALQSGANLILSRGHPGAVEALVSQLSADDSSLPGVIGPARTTECFLQNWYARTGHETRLQMHSRVHELTEVIRPRRPPGVFRRAAISDVEPLAKWVDALNIELRSEDPVTWRTERQEANRSRTHVCLGQRGTCVNGCLRWAHATWHQDQLRLHTA